MKENLEKYLHQIGYSIKGNRLNQYIYDNLGKNTGYRVFGDVETRVELELSDFRGGLTFYLKDSVVEFVDKDTKDSVSIRPKRNKGCFIMFSNFK